MASYTKVVVNGNETVTTVVTLDINTIDTIPLCDIMEGVVTAWSDMPHMAQRGYMTVLAEMLKTKADTVRRCAEEATTNETDREGWEKAKDEAQEHLNEATDNVLFFVQNNCPIEYLIMLGKELVAYSHPLVTAFGKSRAAQRLKDIAFGD